MTQIWSIQYLRGLAALGVVLFHTFESQPEKFTVGAAGVDVFFVISGMVMWGLTQGRPAAPGQFLWRRIARVVPLYWLVTLAVAALVTLRPGYLWMTSAEPAHIALSLLFVPHVNPAGAVAPLLLQGWTLNYEMFFYALFALLLFLPQGFRLPALGATMLALAAFGALARPLGAIAAFYTDPLILEFAAGAGLGWAWSRGLLRGRWIGLLLLAAGFGVLAAEHWGLALPYPRVIRWGLPALAIVAGALCLEAAGGVARAPFLKAVGDGSYATYLVHVVVVEVVHRALGGTDILLRAAIAGALSIWLGVAIYYALEKPMQAGLRALPKALRRSRRQSTIGPQRGADPGIR